MRIDNVKRWQWAVIGIALGLLISFWRGWVGPEGALISRSTLEPVDFEKLLVAKSPASGRPMVTDVRFYGKEDGTEWLTAQQLVRKGNSAMAPGEEVYIPVKIPAKTPYVPAINPPKTVDPNFTVVDYLKEIRRKNPQVRFSTRWWDQEPLRSPLFALVGMALLAVACPPLIHLMLGAGAGREQKNEPEYDLSRFGKGNREPEKPIKRGPTEAELAHLRELEAELEQKLAAKAPSGGGPAASSGATPQEQQHQQQQQPQEIRKLDAGPLESASQDQPKVQKRFGGEFYPTETHVKQDKTDQR